MTPFSSTARVNPFVVPDVAMDGSKFFPHTVRLAGCTPVRAYGLSGPLSPVPASVVAPSTVTPPKAASSASARVITPSANGRRISVARRYRLSLSPAV